MTNPNEQEWYKDDKYWFKYPNGEYGEAKLDEIIAEAERRTWEEALSLMEEEGSREIIRIKLSSLTKK